MGKWASGTGRRGETAPQHAFGGGKRPCDPSDTTERACHGGHRAPTRDARTPGPITGTLAAAGGGARRYRSRSVFCHSAVD